MDAGSVIIDIGVLVIDKTISSLTFYGAMVAYPYLRFVFSGLANPKGYRVRLAANTFSRFPKYRSLIPIVWEFGIRI